MSDSPSPRASLGLLAVRTAALWILTGALFKLFKGSPNDLPPSVVELSRSLFSLGPGMTFKLAIATEISIAVPALLRPRLVWPLVALVLGVFCGVLVPLVLSGESSCGCFGSKVTIPPWVMLSIDGGLLLAILACGPWRSEQRERGLWIPIGLALLFAWIAPFLLVTSGVSLPGAGAAPATAGAGAEQGGAAPELPRYVELEPESWIGKSITETELAALMDVEAYPQDATWILYRVDCDHCAAHLRELGTEFPNDPKIYVFVRLSAEGEEERRVVDVDLMPPGEEALLPAAIDYVVTTPWTLELEAGVVRAAYEPDV